MDRLFSIIIPCYNAAGFIDRAIQSVMDQTLDRSEYEIIAVNDASTDDTLEHLYNWEKQYPETIRVISYEENLRQGGARNKAIKEACGEYLDYLDADDWLEPDALQTYKFGIGEGSYDIVSAKSEESYGYGISYNGTSHADPVIERRYDESCPEDLIAADLGYVCTAVYKKSMVTGNGIWFPEHLAYEDIYWQRMIKFYAKSAAIIDKVTLHHYIHEESTINKRNAPHQTDRLTAYERYLEESKDKGFLEKYYRQIMNDAMETYFFNSYFAFFINMDNTPDVYNRMRSTIFTYFPDWETAYDDSQIPMIFQYLLKFLKKAKTASVADLQPFRDTILESFQ